MAAAVSSLKILQSKIRFKITNVGKVRLEEVCVIRRTLKSRHLEEWSDVAKYEPPPQLELGGMAT